MTFYDAGLWLVGGRLDDVPLPLTHTVPLHRVCGLGMIDASWFGNRPIRAYENGKGLGRKRPYTRLAVYRAEYRDVHVEGAGIGHIGVARWH